ncbi:MAG TPA: DUF1127 domain-containing protein [Dongiaceae bacterium]|nr:DUF1127 domain-containing protein [Dongiaceae bacterium]
MTDLTTACHVLPRSPRRQDRHAGLHTKRDFANAIARALSWMWRQWRRREIIRTLDKVDDRLLRDVGIDRGGIDEFVDALMARWR